MKVPNKPEAPFNAILDKNESQLARAEDLLVRATMEIESLQKKLALAVARINELLEFENSYRLLLGDKTMQVADFIKDQHGIVFIKISDKAALHWNVVPNITNRLNNVCKNLDAIVTLKVDEAGDVSILSTSEHEAASKYGVISIPWSHEWSADPKACMDRISSMVEQFAPARINNHR